MYDKGTADNFCLAFFFQGRELCILLPLAFENDKETKNKPNQITGGWSWFNALTWLGSFQKAVGTPGNCVGLVWRQGATAVLITASVYESRRECFCFNQNSYYKGISNPLWDWTSYFIDLDQEIIKKLQDRPSNRVPLNAGFLMFWGESLLSLVILEEDRTSCLGVHYKAQVAGW